MDSDTARSQDDKRKASSLWVSGLWDKAKRRQKSWGDTAVLESVFQVTVPSGQQKSCIVNGAKAHVMVVQSTLYGRAWIFILCLFIINFILHSDRCVLAHLLWRPTRQNPQSLLFCSTPDNESKRRSEEALLSPSSWSCLPGDHLCCTAFSPNWGKGGKALPAEQWWPQMLSWNVCWGYWLGCGAACISTCISLTSHQLKGVDGAWPVAHTLLLDLGANWWARLPFPPPFSL